MLGVERDEAIRTKAYISDKKTASAMGILDGIKMLENAEKICGHNIIGYDIPVIKKLYPDFQPKGEVADTLIISRVAFPDVKMADYGRFQKGELPGNLIGKYSLEAWGYRMGEFKGGYGKTTDWKVWTPEMTTYCIQDVKVTEKKIPLR